MILVIIRTYLIRLENKMLVKRVPFNMSGVAKAIAATDFTRKVQLGTLGRTMRIRHISVCNETNGGVRANVGYVTDGIAYYVDTIVMTNDTYFYKSNVNMLIPSDFQVIIKFVSPNAGDMFYYSVCGEEEIYMDNRDG